jgi:hypothetical protein
MTIFRQANLCVQLFLENLTSLLKFMKKHITMVKQKSNNYFLELF